MKNHDFQRNPSPIELKIVVWRLNPTESDIEYRCLLAVLPIAPHFGIRAYLNFIHDWSKKNLAVVQSRLHGNHVYRDLASLNLSREHQFQDNIAIAIRVHSERRFCE